MAAHNPSIGGYAVAAAAVGGLAAVAYQLKGRGRTARGNKSKDQGFDPEGWPTETKKPAEMEVAYQRLMLPDDANPHGVSPSSTMGTVGTARRWPVVQRCPPPMYTPITTTCTPWQPRPPMHKLLVCGEG